MSPELVELRCIKCNVSAGFTSTKAARFICADCLKTHGIEALMEAQPVVEQEQRLRIYRWRQSNGIPPVMRGQEIGRSFSGVFHLVKTIDPSFDVVPVGAQIPIFVVRHGEWVSTCDCGQSECHGQYPPIGLHEQYVDLREASCGMVASEYMTETTTRRPPLCSDGCCFECESCAAKPGTPVLCQDCLQRRAACAAKHKAAIDPEPGQIQSMPKYGMIVKVFECPRCLRNGPADWVACPSCDPEGAKANPPMRDHMYEVGQAMARLKEKQFLAALFGDEAKAEAVMSCTCTTADLMAGGCRCGAVQREKGEQL